MDFNLSSTNCVACKKSQCNRGEHLLLLPLASLLKGKEGKENSTRQVLCGTTVYVMRYLGLLSVRVYTLIHRHVSRTSQGSCNLSEPGAEGRQWSYVSWGCTCTQLLLQGLMAPYRKHSTNIVNNISDSSSTALRLAS